MDFIKPTDITDSLFWGANVPEADYDEWVGGSSYAVGDKRIVSTPNVHKVFECLVGQTSGITPDLLDEDGESISDWTEDSAGMGGVIIDPAGQIKFQAGSTGSGDYARIKRTIASPPNLFTMEIKTYFDALYISPGYPPLRLKYGDGSWQFLVYFKSTGLTIYKAGSLSTEVGSDLVKYNTTAAWQTWRFQVDKTTPASATVEVFLKEDGGVFVSQGTFDCDFEPGSGTDGEISLELSSVASYAQRCHVKYLKIATGNSAFETVNDSPVDNSDWLEISATNRWAMFDGTIGNQTSQATPIIMVLAPGAIDSVALLNIESTSVEIVEIDNDDNLVTNGTAWTGATGTTQPTSWDKVGTPADYTIDGGMIKITTDAANEGQSQTITVSAATEYQLLGKYKNTSGDIAQIAIYDVTHSADILATTDLVSSTVESIFSQVFTTPAGCTSIKISLMGKSTGDIVWFDTVTLAPTEYSETVTTGTSKTDVVKLDVPQKTNGILTVTINYTAGTAKIGELIVGVKTNIGTMRYSPSIGITDYSTKTVDVYGHYSIVERSFAKRMNCSLIILNTLVDEVIRLLTLYRSTELVWVGDANYNSLIVYGYYKNFQVVFARPLSSDCALEIEGLT